MKKPESFIFYLLVLLLVSISCNNTTDTSQKQSPLTKEEGTQLSYVLPSPRTTGEVSVEESMLKRRSHRNFEDREISAEQLSQILWAAYGVTQPRTDYRFLRGGFRTAPSAGALYPFEIYVLVGKVKGMEAGVYKYISEEHKLVCVIDKDLRTEVCGAALNQEMIRTAPAVIVYTAVFERMTGKYGQRGRERYVCMDLGHSAQNVYLQAEALHLGTCAIGAFNDAALSEVMQLPAEEEPLYIMPVGRYYAEK